MGEPQGGAKAEPRWSRAANALAMTLAICAMVAGGFARFVVSDGQPLWLDETWTAAIAIQSGFTRFWRQVYLDLNAPLYYLLAHAWSLVAGVSDKALRLPSAVFGAAAPLAIAVAGSLGLARPARLTWAALLALSTPAIYLSGEARSYALLTFLCSVSTVAYIRMLRRPTTGRAAVWTSLSALAILTHYHALLLAGLEGLGYLAYARGRAVRTWPALLAFLPAFGWLAVHAPRIAAFMRPEIAWYPRLKLTQLGAAAAYPFGTVEAGLGVVGVAALAGAVAVTRRWTGTRTQLRDAASLSPLWIAAAAAVAGALVVIAMGFVRPSFTNRYLVPFTPGILLGTVLVAWRLARGGGLALAALIAVVAFAAAPWAYREIRHGWRYYNWEIASRDLMRGRPERLVFVWDHPASPILAPDQLAGVGGFFFARAHAPVEVTPVVLRADQDPNPRLAAEAAGARTALIWAYDVGVRGTAARRFRPRLSALDPTLICRNYGRGSVGVLACDHQGSVNRGGR